MVLGITNKSPAEGSTGNDPDAPLSFRLTGVTEPYVIVARMGSLVGEQFIAAAFDGAAWSFPGTPAHGTGFAPWSGTGSATLVSPGVWDLTIDPLGTWSALLFTDFVHELRTCGMNVFRDQPGVQLSQASASFVTRTAPPFFVSSTPADLAADVDVNTTFAWTFDDQDAGVDPATITISIEEIDGEDPAEDVVVNGVFAVGWSGTIEADGTQVQVLAERSSALNEHTRYAERFAYADRSGNEST